jgi:hypothetical protein
LRLLLSSDFSDGTKRGHLTNSIDGRAILKAGDEMMMGPWINLTLDATLLGLEAQSVIGLRLAQIAKGQGTPAEAQLMVTEKMLAFMDAATTVATGGSAHAVVKDYRKRVQANARRLQTA